MNGQPYICITAAMEWEPAVAEIWPDDDAPAVIVAETIAAVIRNAGGARRVLRDWNLDFELDIVVRRPNPAWNGDDVLFGEAPPREIITSAVAQ